MELTVDQVRAELAELIGKYPDNTGSLEEDDCGEKQCVYFTDAEGRPFGGGMMDYLDEREFVTPVCIIGHWVQDFHPELKQNETFQDVLFTNAIIGNSQAAKLVFPEDVLALLAAAQYQQDDYEKSWKDIDLDRRF